MRRVRWVGVFVVVVVLALAAALVWALYQRLERLRPVSLEKACVD
jgi:hypothetical protein